MEFAVVVALYTLLRMSCLVYANGEPGVNENTLEEGQLPSTTLLSQVPSDVFGSINVTATTSILQSQESTRSPAQAGGITSVTIPEVGTTAGIGQSKASTMNLSHTSIAGSVLSTSLPHGRTSTVVPSQTPGIEQTPAQTTSPQTTSSTHRSISGNGTSTNLLITSTVMNMNQSVSHVVQSNQSSVATRALLPSSSPVKPLLSTTSVLPYSSNIGTSVSPSGLTGYSTSDVTSRSAVMPNASRSQNMTHSATVDLHSVQTSTYQSSSVIVPLPTTSPPPGIPSPPIIRDAKVLSARSVLLNWNATVDQAITNFSVEQSVNLTTWEPSTCNHSLVPAGCVITQKQAVITQLKPYTNYTFRVVARSQFGTSNSSTGSNWIRTDEAAPSVAPVITTTYNVSSQEIFIAWRPPPPESLNGKLRKYEINVKKVTQTIQPTTLPTSKVAPTNSMHNAKSSVAVPNLASSFVLVPSTPIPTTPIGSFPPTEPSEPTEEPEERTTPQDGRPVVIDVVMGLNYTVGNLQKWTSYEVKVRAVTIAPGPFSNKVIVRTDEDVPSQPRQVFAKAVNSSAIFVNWTVPAEMNGLLVKYQVKYSEKDSLQPTSTRDVGQNKSAVLTGLNPFTLYVINVSAFTSKGEGSHAIVDVSTDEGRPSAPRNLSAQSVNSKEILVSWVAPVNPNGRIKYRLSFNNRTQPSKLVYDGNDTQHVVSNLKPYTQYNFSVVAYNVKYNLSSATVDTLETTAQAAPSGPPQNVRAITNSSSSIILYWIPPSIDQQNGVITHYDIRVSSNDSSQALDLKMTSNTTALPVADLQAYTNYSFMVRAVNYAGIGPYSRIVTNRTFEAVPSAPRNISAKSVNSTAIKVTWIKALHPNGIIQYKVYMRLSKEDEQANQLVYEGMDTVYVVAGLQEYVMYTFTVVSFNIKYSWTSKPVVAIETTHPAEPTGPPQNIHALTRSSTCILVKWSPPLPSEQNGLILRYTVTYTSQSGQTKTLDTADNSTSIEVKNLTIFTKYSFSVKALNVIGAGPGSEPVYNKTFEDRPSPPVNVVAKTVNSTAIKVTWGAPLNPNGEILYRLYYWQSDQGAGTKRLAYDGPLSEHVVVGLHEYVTYTFMLQAYNVKHSWSSAAMNVSETTHPAEPSGPPLNVQALTNSSTSILVKWDPPNELDRNGVITHYMVNYSSLSGEASINTTDNSTEILVTHLRKYTSYYFTVRAVNKIGVGPPSGGDVKNTTFEDVPGAPIIDSVVPKTNSLELTWKPPTEPNGIITSFRLCWTSLSVRNTTCVSLNDVARRYEIRNLKAFSEYSVSLAASTSVGLGSTVIKVSKTAEGVPSKPQDLRAWNTSKSSILVTWKKPASVNGNLKGYKVFNRLATDSDDTTPKNAGLRSNFTLTGLEPYTLYDVAVQAFTGAGGGEKSNVKVMTDESAPPPLGTLAPPDKGTIESFSFEVKLTKASNERGVVRYYQVIVIELATDNKDQPVRAAEPDSYKEEDLHTYEQARNKKPQLVPYIAAEFLASDFDHYQSFVVGDGERTPKVFSRRRRDDSTVEFYNGPLEENTFYAVFQRAYVNKGVYTSSSWIEPVETAAAVRPTKSSNVGLIVGLVLVLIILIVVLGAVFFIRRRRLNSDNVLDDRDEYSNGRPVRMKKLSRKRRSLQKKRLMGSTESLTGLNELAASRARRHPVPIDDFERHVDRMHMDGDHGFSEEYLLVQPDEEFNFQQFLNPANKYKNRYANIVAYDHSRVLLNPIEGVAGSDYINASFIDGYNRQRAYIAAQGALMETFDDFWRMIWEQMSSIIVMLTKLEERGRRKCDQYWPERGTRSYGQIQVTLKETLNMSHYTVRKLVMVHKMYPDDERVVKQFHFTAWPDHGVPSHPTPLLSLVRHTFAANRESIGPMVVHCSAGVGRTGTFITLDVMLQRISQEDSIDVFGFVRQMRYQRNFMVQTEAQYVFIHDALLEAITCGVTEVEAKDLGVRIRELRQVDPETGYTYLENEFCRLAKEENHPIAFKSASLNCNTSKNRYANILPFESTRVHLKMRPGEMGSDYINANFIDGYCQPRAYIATQAPVPDTFEDFWRMVWEQECAAVVMLTREEEAGKVKCHHYWPSEGSRLYGVILVELIEEASFGDYASRKFKLTHTEEKDTRTVCQFQYTDWPDTGLPDSGVGIVDLIGQVQKWQQQSGNTAIVLHCSGGVGRTGVFCGVSMMIERLKAEGVIDVFQTVQAMRLQRPAMVQTAEQYEFCYTTLQEYLDSFDLYANFQ